MPDETAANNSYTLEVDGTQCGITVGDAMLPANAWTWVDYRDGNSASKINLTLSAGTHTFTMYGRESGVKLDKVVFSGVTTCVPTGTGSNCAVPPGNTTSVTGDVNSDGTVNVFDLSILLTNWALTGRTRSQGDLDANGTVNIFDLSILLTNWGATGGGTSSCALPKYPDATCTGVPSGTTLAVVNGDMTISASNTVVDSKDIRGCVHINDGVTGVIIRKSEIACGNSIVVQINDKATTGSRLLLEDVEISCNNTSGTGVSEANFTLRRANIYGCENGLDINQEVVVEDSYIHELASIGTDPHEDGIQLAGHFLPGNPTPVQGALNVTIRHNTIFAYNRDTQRFGTSAIITNPVGDVNILIEDNLMAGGAATLYCPTDSTGNNFRVLRNHFSTQFKSTVGFYFPSTGCSDEILSGNVYHETGQPINLD
jgi:hypothetical protein